METQNTNGTKQLGRKRNPAITRTIFLNSDNKPRTKGAPKIGTEVRAVDVQRSIKNVDFVYGVTPHTNERTMVVPARSPRAAKTVEVIPVNPVNPVNPLTEEKVAPLEELVSVGHAAYPVPN